MAYMFPKRIPAKASQGVKMTFYLLERLPDTCLVYYEPAIARRYPHFIVLLPEAGVLLIDVCEWRPDSIEQFGDAGAIVGGRPEKLPHDKIDEYLHELMSNCKQLKTDDLLLHTSEAGEDRFSVPFAYAVVVPYIEAEQLAQLPQFAPQNTITSERLLELYDQVLSQTLSPEQALELCKGFFNQKWPDSLVDVDKVLSHLRALIHPEITIAPPPYGITKGQGTAQTEQDSGTNPVQPQPGRKPMTPDKSLKVLDIAQEQAAMSLGTGHRLLWGVAGSGKTIILIARAKLLARVNPEAKILVTCFNVTLAHYLKHAFEGFPQITAAHFHSVAFSAWKMRFNPNETPEQYSERLKNTVEGWTKPTTKYDMILIDEAQDFDPEWFRSLLTLMKDPDKGDFVIVGDGMQGIYKSRKISWKSLGIHAMGRTAYFKKNYRNSREIIELAAKFGGTAPAAESDEASVESVVLSPDCAVRSSGIKPVLVRGSHEENAHKVVAMIEGLLNGSFNGLEVEKLEEGEIAVLYATNEDVSDCMNEICKVLRKKNVSILRVFTRKQKEQICSTDMKVLTIYSAKGLQYRAVFVLGVDSLPRDTEVFSREADEKLMYVGLTRAEDYLVMVAGEKNSEFVDRLTEAVSEGLVEEYHGGV